MKSYVLAAPLIVLGVLATTRGEEPIAPGGWQKAGSREKYRVGLDRTIRHGGKSAGFVQSTADPLGEGAFGAFEQVLNAQDYHGKRLRLTAFVKTKDVDDWSGVWMRIDGRRPNAAFDNMQQRPIKGTTDWTAYEVVLDVPNDAIDIAFGVLQAGPGQTWVDDVLLEAVGDDVAVTQTEPENRDGSPERPPEQIAESEKWAQGLPSRLENASFEQSRLEYDLALMQGLWEAEKPAEYDSGFGRITKHLEGNKETVTFYNSNGDVLSQHTVDFNLEQSGRVSLFTFRNMKITAGESKGRAMPKGVSRSYIYTVNRGAFVEILGALDGSTSQPQMTQWKRAAGQE
jgi:hypothetical protein